MIADKEVKIIWEYMLIGQSHLHRGHQKDVRMQERDMDVNSLLMKLWVTGPTFFCFAPHPVSRLLPCLPDSWAGVTSVFPLGSSLVSIISCLPLSSLFYSHTYASLFTSAKKNHFSCSWLISLQTSQLLPPSNLVQASSTNYSPCIMKISFLSFLCEIHTRIYSTLFHH